MAIDFSKFKFFNRLDARSRIFVLLAAVVGIVLIIYLGTRFLSGGDTGAGGSRVAGAPAGLQSVPGETPSPEYYRALEQLNQQRAQQAQMTGGSAVPTLINPGQPSTAGCVICEAEAANVKNKLDDWARQGKISPELAAELQALADKGACETDFSVRLDQLVKQGKLTPEQARELLDLCRKQHANQLLNDSAKLMDEMIKNGQLPLDVANDLLAAQKNKMSPADYAAELQRLVREGKLSPEAAQRLLAQYFQQRAKEIITRSIATLQQMSSAGQITPDVLKDLINLETNMIPLNSFTAVVQKYVGAGKLVPAVADKIIAEYKQQKEEIGTTQTVNQLLEQAEAAAYKEISDLLKEGKITPDVANLLLTMIQKNVSLDDFQKMLTVLVDQKKLSPEIAKLKLADYQKVKGLRELAARLSALQANNASLTDYANELKRAVQAGLITPEEAARLMQEYQAMLAKATGPTGPAASAEFARLQAQVQQAGVTGPPPTTDFATAQTQATQESAQDRAARIQALLQAMSGQAQQLIVAWQPPVMVYKEGAQTTTTKTTATAEAGAAGGKTTTTTTTTTTGAPLIKAGTILFAVLDTAVNSDYPDSPVMATIVQGPFKGAKLLGKLQTTKSVAGQMDRITLNFTMMNEDAWPTTKNITAYAIDPDTARTVLASSVNYHYMLRFGAIMATSFLQGYASAIVTSSSTSTTGIFGTSTTHPSLSPGQKLAVGLGQVGQTLGAVTQNYINIPPTVRVDSGVGLGILFMADVS